MKTLCGIVANVFVSIAFFGFVACGDDSSSDASSSQLPESIENFIDIENIACNEERQCAKILIEEYDDYMQCVDFKWVSYIASNPNQECLDAESSSSQNVAGSSSSGNVIEGSSTSEQSDSSKEKSSSSKYAFVWNAPAEALNCTCDESREGLIGLARYDDDSELVCFHSEEIDRWGWVDVSRLSSSSSVAPQSSSYVKRSSSSRYKRSSASTAFVDPSTVVKGTMTDERDGQTYKTVKIGTQTWMAENLNYNYNTGITIGKSYCYGNASSSCDKYGRLYTWPSAMDVAGKFSETGRGCSDLEYCNPVGVVRGVCPSGWHLPSYYEWFALFSAVGGKSTASYFLKSDSGWYSKCEKCSDAYGFSVLPAGFGYGGGFSRESENGYFWSSTEGDEYGGLAVYTAMDYYSQSPSLGEQEKSYALSVRCVKDFNDEFSSSSVDAESSSSSAPLSSSVQLSSSEMNGSSAAISSDSVVSSSAGLSN